MVTIASLIEIIIDADDRASSKFNQVSRNARRMQMIIAGITLAAAAFTPALLGGLGAVAAMFGTAGLAAAGFGALAGTTIMQAWEKASDLEDAMLDVNAAMINNDAKGYAKAMAKVQAIWDSMTDSEKKAVIAINEFKSEWQDMQIQMSPVTLELMAESLNFLTKTMTGMFPAMKGVGLSFTNMFAYMNQAIDQGRVEPFFRFMNAYAVPHFERVMLSAGNILKAFGGIMMAFNPIGLAFGDWLVKITDDFANWAWSLGENKAFYEFTQMVMQNAPIISAFIGAVVDVLWQIIVTLNPVTMEVLEATTAFLRWAQESGALDTVLRLIIGAIRLFLENANWLIPILGSVYLGFKALMFIDTITRLFGSNTLAGKVMGSVFKSLGSVIGFATRAFRVFGLVLIGTPIGWVIGLIGALIAIGVLLYQNWDEIIKWGKELWSNIQRDWGNIKKEVGESYNAMTKDLKDWWRDTKQYWTDAYNTTVTKATEMYNGAVSKYHEMKEGAKSKLIEMVIDASNKWTDLKNTAYENASSMWNAGVANARNFKEGLSSKLDGLGSMMWNGLNDMWKSIMGWGKTFYNSGKGLLGEFADGIWSGIEKAYNNLWEGLKYIRNLLPFSPAKEGPLSDLDKSGKAFFPTWYEAAMTQVGSMQRNVAGAFQGVANEANVALAGTGLEAFTGGATTFTVRHVVTGEVGIDGSGLEDIKQDINSVVTQSGTGLQGGYGFDKVSIRKI